MVFVNSSQNYAEKFFILNLEEKELTGFFWVVE